MITDSDHIDATSSVEFGRRLKRIHGRVNPYSEIEVLQRDRHKDRYIQTRNYGRVR